MYSWVIAGVADALHLNQDLSAPGESAGRPLLKLRLRARFPRFMA